MSIISWLHFRHGVRQLLSCWADGVAYITQCPIKPNETYVYRFSIVDQRGTLLWHGHKSWQRATLYGAFIILPRVNVHPPYPFEIHPQELDPLILGGYWYQEKLEHCSLKQSNFISHNFLYKIDP